MKSAGRFLSNAGDSISARFLFGEWFDFYFSGKLWIATNHKPTISDHSKGFWDRLKLVPFTQSIPVCLYSTSYSVSASKNRGRVQCFASSQAEETNSQAE